MTEKTKWRDTVAESMPADKVTVVVHERETRMSAEQQDAMRDAQLITEIRDAAQEFYDSAIACDTPALARFRRQRNLRGNALVDASDRYAALLSENARLREALRDATTPNQFWLVDNPESCASDPNEFVECDDLDPNTVAEILTGRSLPNAWVAHVVIPATAERDEDYEVQMFATEAEALAAIAESSRTPMEPEPRRIGPYSCRGHWHAHEDDDTPFATEAEARAVWDAHVAEFPEVATPNPRAPQ